MVKNILLEENLSLEKITKIIENKNLFSKLREKNIEISKLDLKNSNTFDYKIRKLSKNNNAEELKKIMSGYCDNLIAVCGLTLAANLIAAIGSLKELAIKPSGTILTIGDEKNFFSKSSFKDSILMKHTKDIKEARKLASKISIAAKKDYFKKK